ncbi:zinc ABC transporter substrate-binding protein [Actinomadura darangshiensis]|uniref:Zinc ABC transporter substrate-binding protein n=1 Tax=Actinomadura darangshiensis TaxID=705336 RepID=A0A4V6PET8_9ACTN|nr:metal ABC transporter substrate-binding protein [Actinomadura darangshiensis]TDD80807.1 zinc ABC transporter substrate-binding protein [Actinomadura darangshiensis]
MSRTRTALRAAPATALALAGLAAGLTGCTAADADVPPGKTAVVASFYPVAWLAEEVGGSDVFVRTLTKPGTEPHDLELTARQVANVADADFAVYVKGVQPAVDDAVQGHAKDRSLDAASLVETLPPPDETDDEEAHDGIRHRDAPYDPHIWLDPSRMAAVATALGDRLATADPGHATGYRERARTTAGRLTALDREFRDGLKSCGRKEIVTAHAAFGYLADRYGLRQIPVAGVDPSAEPSPKRLAELTRLVSATGATTVFTETLASPEVAESLAREAGVRTAVLDPVEGIEDGASGDYLTIMRKNLRTLRPALECS